MSRWVDLDDDCHRFCGPDGYYERWYIDPEGINEQTDDLINRKTTIEYLRLKATRIGAYGFLTAEEIKKYIDGMPSVQPEVVRCKDCMNYYWPENREPKEREWTCWKYGIPREPDDFCSNAKRKPGGEKEENE